MKNILKKYIKNYKEFLNNKQFIIFLILTSLLSFGFMLTHFSIGVDDLALDRYVDGTYILSAGRYGTWLLYNIFRINTFTPFWLDFICILLLLFTAILLCCYFKEVTKNKLNKISYILFSCGFISYPIINNFIIYQPTNLSVIISNLFIVICMIFLYENYFIKNNKKLNYKIILLLPLFISMYESCCQTYCLLVFITCFLYNIYNKKINLKDIFKFIIYCFITLLISIVINSIIVYIVKLILDYNNLLVKDYSFKHSIFGEVKSLVDFILLVLYKIGAIMFDKNFYIKQYLIFAFIFVSITFIDLLNKKEINKFIFSILICLSNILLLMYLLYNIYRICYSWTIFIGFVFMFIYERFKEKKIFSKVTLIVISFIILMNSKSMNQLFYNDYRGYKNDILYANTLVNEIYEKCKDYDKPLLFVYDDDREYKLNIPELSLENRYNYFDWSVNAFESDGRETLKFINHLGYDFELVENYDRAFEDYYFKYNNMSDEIVKEYDEFIVVKIRRE